MDTTLSTPPPVDAQQILAAALAHQVERMSKQEVQELVAKALTDVERENAAMRKRIDELEKENARLLWQISRSLFDEKDYDHFDPSAYSIPAEEMLSNAKSQIDKGNAGESR